MKNQEFKKSDDLNEVKNDIIQSISPLDIEDKDGTVLKVLTALKTKGYVIGKEVDKECPYDYKIVIGDRSGDGHGLNHVNYFSSNYTLKMIQKVYEDLCINIGFKFSEGRGEEPLVFKQCQELFTQYGSDKVPSDFAYVIASRFGINVYEHAEVIDSTTVDDEEVLIYAMQGYNFAEFLFMLLQKQDPVFKYEFGTHSKPSAKDLIDLTNWIGYGLFDAD